MRMFLVRHGEVAANRDFAFVGHAEDPLTEVGVEQVAGLASFFAGLSIDRVLCSPLARCLETARAIAEATGHEVEADPRIIEQSFGEWEGLTRADIDARGQTASDELRAWLLDPSGRPPAGESLHQVSERAIGLVRELVTQRLRNVVCVSHVGPIKTLVCHVLDLPLSQVGRFFLDPASITVIDWQSTPVLRVFNAHTEEGWHHARWLTSK